MTETKLEEVMAELGTKTRGEGPQQFTASARLAAAKYARERMTSGERLEDVANELKVKKWTLQKWLQRQGRGNWEGQKVKGAGRFERVKVRSAAPQSTRVVVHGAHGVRVEGLTLENIAALLERLGCSA